MVRNNDNRRKKNSVNWWAMLAFLFVILTLTQLWYSTQRTSLHYLAFQLDGLILNNEFLSQNKPPLSHRLNYSNIDSGQSKQEHTKDFHLVFSTGCNAFQDWQSYVFFYQVYKSGQEGNVTRVASGCTEHDAVSLKRLFQEQIQSIPGCSERFHLHLTPDYSKSTKENVNYIFFNKPKGLYHWMQYGLGFPNALPQYDNTIIVILDPDQFLLRPFQANYTNDPTMSWHKPSPDQDTFEIRKGQPFSQLYGFGTNFKSKLDKNISHIVEAIPHVTNPYDRTSSHLYNLSFTQVAKSYVAGPPYIAVASDMYQIVETWAAIVLAVYDLTEDHLSEMFAYSTAAAHLNLPHQLSYSFMISAADGAGGEGWDTIDAAEPQDICRHVQSDENDPNRLAWSAKLPQVLHYCQRYYLGPYFFNKYKLPKNWLSCGQPLLKDPLDNEGSNFTIMYKDSVTPNHDVHLLSPREIKRHGFALCYIITIMNDAVSFWKEQYCLMKDEPNFNKTYLFPKDAVKTR